MGYKIITDSTIDMDHKMIEELGLTVVPLRFTIDGKTYKDKADLSDMPTETFYAKLREGKMSTTSQINADEFTRVFEPVLQGGEDVLYIAFSSGLSGTCQSAFIARDELKEKYPERKIYVFDSLCASLGEGLLVYHAAMLKRAGTDIDSLYKWLGEAEARGSEREGARGLGCLEPPERRPLVHGGRPQPLKARRPRFCHSSARRHFARRKTRFACG